jgi:cytochrome c553
MHASIEGAEPAPVDGPAPHVLFSKNFNVTRTLNPYLETDDFCFQCHSDYGQQVINQDYSAAFGGATIGTGPGSILAAFNQASYHNLYDIWNFLHDKPAYPWFGDDGNPCSACHNSHLAKRNWDSGRPGFPLLSAIAKPDNHSTLWGETELMQSYFSYEAPFSFSIGREPAGVGDANGGKTPDYVAFCTSCHNVDNVIWSTTLSREITKIDWGITGLQQDKHGPFVRDGASQFREPYAAAAAIKSNFVLSCLDCHEPHGSDNVMLLRRRINGEDLGVAVSSTDTMGEACKRCHMDDLAAAAGTGQADRWEYVHHGASGAPYVKADCSTNCHFIADGSTPVACGNCHGHGKIDSWAGANQTGRKTF